MSAIYINLPVRDVTAARNFYERIGLKLNEAFTNDQNAVFNIDSNIFLMLVEETIFKQNSNLQIADTRTSNEVGLAIEVADRLQVDSMAEAARSVGAREYHQTIEDENGMYSRGITDLDGHQIDFLCMEAAYDGPVQSTDE